MQMRPRSAARLADVADDLPTDDVFAGNHGNRRKVPIKRCYVVTMVEHHFATIPRPHRGSADDSITGRAHRRTVGALNVDARMKCALAVDRIFPLTETRTHAAFKRPKRGRVGQLRPIAGKTRRKTALQSARDTARHGLRAERIKLVDGQSDLLLIEVARRASSCIRETDTAARLGGDEFVVILSELDGDKSHSTRQAGYVAEKIRSILAEPYILTVEKNGVEETLSHDCTPSIGVTLFIDSRLSPQDILKQADAAMYRAKNAGKNKVCFYETAS